MFFLKIIGRKRYQQLLNERNRLRQQQRQLENHCSALEMQNKQLEVQLQKGVVESKALQHQGLEEGESEKTDEMMKELEFSWEQIEKLQADRSDLIELYIDKLYALAKGFARANREMKKNRGLFLILVDRRHMVDANFSNFHDGQSEYLMQSRYQEIDQLPHLFSTQIEDLFNYLGEKIPLKDDTGAVTGYKERDGALLIDLRGVAFRSCVMVEGVRTHRVYKKVERLQKGSAKHNAAIYASSLDEVMATVVVSEETSEVTLFRDGRFLKRYNPYTDVETLRDEKVVPIKRTENAVNPTTDQRLRDAAIAENDQLRPIDEQEFNCLAFADSNW